MEQLSRGGEATAPPPTPGSRQEKNYPKELFKNPDATERNKTMAAYVDVSGVQHLTSYGQ